VPRRRDNVSQKCLFACGVTNRLSRDEESGPCETEKPLSIREFGPGTGNAVCPCEQGCAYEASKLATIKSGLRRALPEISQHVLNESMNADRRLPIYSGNETTISRETFLASLNRLDVFHRTVLLLRLYGGYRAHEVSLLLRLQRNAIQQRDDPCASCPGVLPHWIRRRRSPCEGYFAGSTTDAEYGAEPQLADPSAAAAPCARSH